MANSKFYMVLRVALFAAAFGWGICLFGIFMPWTFALEQLQDLGGSINSNPMINYWFRMACCGFGFIGILFLLMAINPKKNWDQIKIAGIFKITLGVILLFYGIKLKLFILPYLIDSLFCLTIGVIILGSIFCLSRESGKIDKEDCL